VIRSLAETAQQGYATREETRELEYLIAVVRQRQNELM